MALINRHGYQLFPERGSPEIIHDPDWMYTSNWSLSSSAVKEYTFKQEDDMLGSGNDFITHAEITMKNGGKWDFKKVDAVKNEMDEVFKYY